MRSLRRWFYGDVVSTAGSVDVAPKMENNRNGHHGDSTTPRLRAVCYALAVNSPSRRRFITCEQYTISRSAYMLPPRVDLNTIANELPVLALFRQQADGCHILQQICAAIFSKAS